VPIAETEHFGAITYIEDSVIEFPEGIPAFETERRFLLIERESSAPVVFLQSLQRPDLLFLTLPASAIDPSYHGCVPAEDLERLGLPSGRYPEEGSQVLTLALVTVREDRSATANLMAPVIVNLATRRALQSVQPDSGYSVAVRLRGSRQGKEA
jgi:flagellar assembly factor FliW